MRSLSLELGSRDLERITDDGKTMSAVPRSRFRGDVVATDLSELPGVLQTVHDSFTPPLTHGADYTNESTRRGVPEVGSRVAWRVSETPRLTTIQ